jgi:type II secretory pathway pseudopilin PulG
MMCETRIMNLPKNRSGFTLIEVLLMVALIIAIGAASLPTFLQPIFSRQTEAVASELAGSLKKAQSYSMVGKGGAQWGVAVRDGAIVLFQGDTYADRNSVHDESYVIPHGIDISGFDETVFARVTGRPDTTPETTISRGETSHSYILTTEGVFEEQ